MALFDAPIIQNGSKNTIPARKHRQKYTLTLKRLEWRRSLPVTAPGRGDGGKTREVNWIHTHKLEG